MTRKTMANHWQISYRALEVSPSPLCLHPSLDLIACSVLALVF